MPRSEISLLPRDEFVRTLGAMFSLDLTADEVLIARADSLQMLELLFFVDGKVGRDFFGYVTDVDWPLLTAATLYDLYLEAVVADSFSSGGETDRHNDRI